MTGEQMMFKIGEMSREIDALKARLAAAEKVVEAGKLVIKSDGHLGDLLDAIDAYSTHKQEAKP